MKKHANTLYVTTQGAYLAKERQNVVIRVENEIKLRLPIHTLDSIVCFGQVSCSPFAMGLCAAQGVGISFMTEPGRFMARVEGPISGNVLLRREQYRQADDDKKSSAIAQAVIAAKIANSRCVLQRSLRDHPDKRGRDSLLFAIDVLAGLIDQLASPLEMDQIRGIEGEAARHYFGVFDHQITSQKESFQFTVRSRRPPLDNINALLSFLYAILAQDARSACEATGLDPQVGFLHRDRPGRPSLALDLMEEFRAMLADRIVLSLVNRRQVNAKGFRKTPSGGVEMSDETRKTVLIAYQKRKADSMVHPFLNEEVTIGLLLHIQARLLARYLRGDLDAYPPFFWK